MPVFLIDRKHSSVEADRMLIMVLKPYKPHETMKKYGFYYVNQGQYGVLHEKIEEVRE
ncbi:MAG: hypothetical protein ACP5IB_08635 [Thermoplasmata archaeon]